MQPWQFIWPVRSTFGHCQCQKGLSKIVITWNFYLPLWILFCESIERKVNSASRESLHIWENWYIIALLATRFPGLGHSYTSPLDMPVDPCPLKVLYPAQISWKNTECGDRLSSIVFPRDIYFVWKLEVDIQELARKKGELEDVSQCSPKSCGLGRVAICLS